jgi:type I restriction enzyme R subunit
MSKPSEHKTVQARILAYAREIGWSLVVREEAELRRGKTKGGQEFPPSLFFEDLLHAQVLKFNPRYAEADGALPGKCRHLHADIFGNRQFVEHLRNRGKFFDHEEKRERDLTGRVVTLIIGNRRVAFSAGAGRVVFRSPL